MRQALPPAVIVASGVQPRSSEARSGAAGAGNPGRLEALARPRPRQRNPAAPVQRKTPPSDRAPAAALVATSCSATRSQRDRGARLPAPQDPRAHPEPAAVVAWMELMRRRLAVSFKACSFC